MCVCVSASVCWFPSQKWTATNTKATATTTHFYSVAQWVYSVCKCIFTLCIEIVPQFFFFMTREKQESNAGVATAAAAATSTTIFCRLLHLSFVAWKYTKDASKLNLNIYGRTFLFAPAKGWHSFISFYCVLYSLPVQIDSQDSMKFMLKVHSKPYTNAILSDFKWTILLLFISGT